MKSRMSVTVVLLVAVLSMFLLTSTLSMGAAPALAGEIVFGGNWVELPFLMDLYREYEKLHPGVKIKTQVVPGPPELWVWLSAQLAARTTPTLITMQPETISTVKKIVQPLDSYYRKKNPYTGNIWKDDIDPNILRICSLGTRTQLAYPTVLLTTRLVYNKNNLTKLGINVSPQWTFSDLITAMTKLKNAGFIAYALGGMYDLQVSWHTWAFVEAFVIRNKLKQLDVLPKDGTLTTEEYARGFKKGFLDPVGDPAWADAFKHIKQLLSFHQKGAIGDWGYDQARMTGKTGFMWEGSWVTATLLNQLKEAGNPWEVGTLPFGTFPPIVEGGKKIELPSLNNTLGVILTKDSSENQKKIAVDFLMWLHSEKPQKVLGAVFGMSVNKNVKVEGEIPRLFAPIPGERPVVYAMALVMDAQVAQDQTVAWQSWFLEKTSDAELLNSLKTIFLNGANRTIANEKFDTSKW